VVFGLGGMHFRDGTDGVMGVVEYGGLTLKRGNASVTAGKHAKAWTPNSAARCPRFSASAVTEALPNGLLFAGLRPAFSCHKSLLTGRQ